MPRCVYGRASGWRPTRQTPRLVQAHAQASIKDAWRLQAEKLLGACCAAVVSLASPADASLDLPLPLSAVASAPAVQTEGQQTEEQDPYTQTLQRRHNRSKGIVSDASSNEDMMMAHAEEMFTRDAWIGMHRLVEYGRYVDELEAAEEAPGCSECTANRERLEHAWQVVANEFYDPYEHFSQGDWAGELKRTLEESGGTLKSKKEYYAAAKSLIGRLNDKYSEYLEPSAFRAAIRKPTKAELDYLSEQAVGVGMKLGERAHDTGRVVTVTLSGSAAEAAGIRIGDVVMSIGGLPTAGFNETQLKQQLRGPVGSTVDVAVVHKRPWLASAKSAAPEELALVRQTLQQPAATSAIVRDPSRPGHVAQYIRINYFSSDATRAVMKGIVEGEVLGVDGYIIDLRNNPGGVFEEAIAISSYFLDDVTETPIVETVRTTDPTTRRNIIDNVWKVGLLPPDVFPKHAWGLTSRPVALLTNRGTASASEVMAGALQDNQRATVIGEPTFGKGVVQFFFRMDDGSGLKLTVAKYLTPNYRDISLQGGLAPDRICHDTPQGIVPQSTPDQCIRQGLRYVSTHPPLAGGPAMQAAR